ncbi:hypothetical protein KKJ25_22600, partial [Xenorhabdus bovienii]|uniref:hypothetical protein n=1 Tax=Xenorhabdus bovienii TaxID=40576 RepID=UPI00237CF381
LDRVVKQQVHHPQRDAVQTQGQGVGPNPAPAPGPPKRHQHQSGKHQPVSGGALGPHGWEQAFGKRGAHAQRHQRAQQGGHRPDGKGQ